MAPCYSDSCRYSRAKEHFILEPIFQTLGINQRECLGCPNGPYIWAQGLYIESRRTSPKGYVAGDMAEFWRKRNGPMPKNWVEGLWRPT